MKSNTIKILSISFLLFSSCLFFTNCQQEEAAETSLPFLSLEAGVNFSNLSNNEIKIIGKAFERFTISFDEGFFHIEETSGAQVNISEELYVFFKTIEDNNKRTITSGFTPSIPRLRSISESGGGNTPTDCVAYTIADALASYNVNMSVNDISSWIESQYGTNGVPGDAYYTVLNHYLAGSPVPLPPAYISGGSAYRTLMAIRTDSGGHAVTLISINGTTVVYQDNQNGGQFGQCNTWDILYLYNVHGTNY